MSRLEVARELEIISLDQPFSNFDFAELSFEGSFPIRRLFSQARSKSCRTLVLEDVSPAAAVEDENREIRSIFPDHSMGGLKRLSFWKPRFEDVSELLGLHDEDGIGFAILKLDICPSRRYRKWHIFESAITKYDHHHNYVPCAKRFCFRAGPSLFHVTGVLYCQQNSLNKACAQVALRSICSTYLDDAELTYSAINKLAFAGLETIDPWRGLRTDQIPRVLVGLGIPYFDFDYAANPTMRDTLPYQRLVYSGLEAGAGALMAFSLSGPAAGADGHIVPVFGHTFNEDTWAPNAEGDYFNIGTELRYMPSDAWLSSFLVHDDNYKSNLSIPKAFLRRENVRYALALLPKGFAYNGLFAEFAASDYFYSLLGTQSASNNAWRNRLLHYAQNRKLILRVVPMTRHGYLQHLRESEDWHGKSEDEATLQQLARIRSECMWMIEVSIPDLFSTNKRKIGELLLDASQPFKAKLDFSLFVLARFPECYLFFESLGSDNLPSFLKVPSSLTSHIPLVIR